MNLFTALSSLAGGALIGLSASALLLFNGRLAGISGILAGLVVPRPGEVAWRAWFVAGLVVAGLAAALVAPGALGEAPPVSHLGVVAAGLLVGFGTRLGSGCTSGHGVCGLGLFSKRSLFATLTFMATGAASVFVLRHLIGGAL